MSVENSLFLARHVDFPSWFRQLVCELALVSHQVRFHAALQPNHDIAKASSCDSLRARESKARVCLMVGVLQLLQDPLLGDVLELRQAEVGGCTLGGSSKRAISALLQQLGPHGTPQDRVALGLDPGTVVVDLCLRLPDLQAVGAGACGGGDGDEVLAVAEVGILGRDCYLVLPVPLRPPVEVPLGGFGIRARDEEVRVALLVLGLDEDVQLSGEVAARLEEVNEVDLPRELRDVGAIDHRGVRDLELLERLLLFRGIVGPDVGVA
eukprot:748852-Hanusia_phi.AAC.2